MNSIWPGLLADVMCLIMSIPCFAMAGECALSLNSGRPSNAIIPGSLDTDT